MIFRFKAKDSFFPQVFEGSGLEYDSYEQAEREIKEFYAQELDTVEEEIEIIELVEVV